MRTATDEQKEEACAGTSAGSHHHEACHTAANDAVRKSHHSDKMKSSLVSRLNRIEGQIRGLKGLIEKDTYCDDVLIQIASVQSALNGVGKLLLEEHMRSCVVERLQDGDTDVISELLTTMNKLMK
ncbi:metal-sensitive transcriptional regulator [Paenibacillus sp. PR3]|uniref:Metal-sensitive transcriptional regulator n=1 Tax=Paenibacillus terricola TaxID=2763503 RepID=A0ABR8MYW2_9BACL|nr:metal-sensitive transcriptional regulator [Paenibacillus terricola]